MFTKIYIFPFFHFLSVERKKEWGKKDNHMLLHICYVPGIRLDAYTDTVLNVCVCVCNAFFIMND